MARTTVRSIIDRTIRQLNSSIRTELNTLAGNVSSSDTTLTLTYDLTPAYRLGSVLSINLELMRILSVDTTTKTVTVMRGWQDSEPAAHTANDEVHVNPRFNRYEAYDALIDEVTSWEPDLFKVITYEWTVESNQETVELPSSLAQALGIIRLRRNWTDEESSSWPQIKFRVQKGDSSVWSGASTSGLVIRLVGFNNHIRDGKIMAQVAYPFIVDDTLTETDDLVSDIGLQRSMLDLLVMGIKVRLLSDDENNRASRQPADESRRAGDVPVNRGLELAQTVRANYTRRYAAEVLKLKASYPMVAW